MDWHKTKDGLPKKEGLYIVAWEDKGRWRQSYFHPAPYLGQNIHNWDALNDGNSFAEPIWWAEVVGDEKEVP